MLSRRQIMMNGAASLAGAALLDRIAQAQQTQPAAAAAVPAAGARAPARGYLPVVTPDGSTAPFKLVDGVKVFHLVAGPCKREFAPGLVVDCWGYNGQTPGPTIELVEGDRVRIYVTNNLPEATTVHWHGMLLPCGMDGVAGLTQKPIPPGQTWKYEFDVRGQTGTLMYHPHFDEMTQLAMGMMGLIVIHPKEPTGEPVDRDYALMLGEWHIPAGATKPNTLTMNEFNVLTINSKSFPGTSPLVARRGERVRIRIGNLGPMDHHPIHLHGYQFEVTGTEAGPIPPAARHKVTTVLVPVGTTRDIEFVADAAGDWAMHCHMTHHMMNQMGHDFPNMLGAKTDGLDERVQKLLPEYMTMGTQGMGDMHQMRQPKNTIAMVGGRGPFSNIDMGGMFTILKVRDEVDAGTAAGWFQHPPGTVVGPASADDLAALRALGLRTQQPVPTGAPGGQPTSPAEHPQSGHKH
ncbi:MAG TPA: copper oxidase [Humisphaera sp.]